MASKSPAPWVEVSCRAHCRCFGVDHADVASRVQDLMNPLRTPTISLQYLQVPVPKVTTLRNTSGNKRC